MAPVTEVVLLTLVPNADHGVIAESAQILARQPGCVAVRTARLVDEPDKLHYFIDWDSVAAHMAFAHDKAVYAPFRARVGTVMAGFAPPFHVALVPYPLTVLDGVAMVGRAWFRAAATPAETEGEVEVEVETAVEACVAVVRGVDGFNGLVARGWSVEEEIVFRGDTCRVFVFAVGWEDTEAYVRFRKALEYERAVAPFRALRGLKELEVCAVHAPDGTG